MPVGDVAVTLSLRIGGFVIHQMEDFAGENVIPHRSMGDAKKLIA
jgi:hypothetical protein